MRRAPRIVAPVDMAEYASNHATHIKGTADSYDWCKELCDAIEEIKRGDDVVNIYLCKNGEYDNF